MPYPPFILFQISVGMRITSIDRDNFDVIVHVLRRSPSNTVSHHKDNFQGEMKKKSEEIHALIGEDYDPKSKLEKFNFDNILQFSDDFGVILVDSVCTRITRNRACSSLSLRLDLNGETFTITSDELSSMLHEYTA